MVGIQQPQGYRATTRKQFTHFIDFRRMKDRVDLGPTQCFILKSGPLHW